MTISIIHNTLSTLTMSSREIAELTGKRHNDVLRDIRNMASALSRSFAQKSEPSAGGRPLKVFLLHKREALILMSGYSVELRARIIDRWMELEEAALEAPPCLSALRSRYPLMVARKQSNLPGRCGECW